MLRAGMLHRGPWKWLQAPGRKRKRVEIDAGGQGEGNEGGGQGEGNGVGGPDEGNGVGGPGEGNGDGGQGGVFLPDVPRRILWGRRSHLDGKAWTCECGHRNYPSRELFVDLPAFGCNNCHVKRREDFHFSFGNLEANGKCPIGEILNQGEHDDCLLFALAKAAEMTDSILQILLDSHLVVPTLDPYSLRRAYRSSRLADGYEEADIDYLEDAAMEKMFELMQTVGVQDRSRQYTCKIGGVEQVEGYFEDIATEIAKGYPLMVEIIPGENLGSLQYGQVYRCPYNNRTVKAGSTVMMHMVILVGAARLGDRDYFYFLNSIGEYWCVRYHSSGEKTKGGIGKLAANDISCQPYKFLRMVQP